MRDGWVETTLGDVAEVVSGGTPSTTVPEYWNGETIWVTPTEVTANEGTVISTSERRITRAGLESSSAKLVPAGTVLLTSRATIGAVALAGTELCTNQGFASLVANERALPRFLMYWCQQNKAEFESRAAGNTFKEISRKKVADVLISLPLLNEQRRIVDVIESVDNYITALEKRAEAARTARSALLHDLLSNPGPDWCSFRVRDLAVEKGLIGGPFGSSLIATDYVESGIPVIRGQNMPDSQRFVGGEFVFVSEDKAVELKRNQAVPGDLVATQRGTLGQVALVPSDGYSQYVISQSQMRLRVDESQAQTSFVYLWLDWDETRATIDSRKSATANPHINLGIFGDLEGDLPPLRRQRVIVDLVAPVDQLILHLVNSISSAKNLRSALLSDLFSGNHEISVAYDELLRAA